MLIKDNFLFFWRTEDIYSQWHPSSFIDDGDGSASATVLYENAEQYMMAQKAILFKDDATFKLILKEIDPRKIKALGRQVKNYNDDVWLRNRYRIVRRGNLLKFAQNLDLSRQLLETNELILVEASPYDKIWGVGMAEDHPDITDPTKWNGLNLLGKALMDVRSELRADNIIF